MESFIHYSLGPTYCCDLLAYMNKQRQLGWENVCDVRFIMGDKTIYAHRSVLAVHSSYFEGMLSGAFSESQGEGGTNSKMMEIDLSGSMCTSEDLDMLLTAIYTGVVKLSKKNIMGVTELACFLLVDCVREVCEKFLMEVLDIMCCLQILDVAHKFDLTCLFKGCRQILQGRFHDHFIHKQEMLLTPPSCLKNLTKIFKYVRFHDLIQFLTRWVDHSWNIEGEVCEKEEKVRRLTVACDIVRSVVSDLKEDTEHLHQVRREKLEGSADVIEKLLSQEKETASSTAKMKTRRDSETEGRNDTDEDEETVIIDSGNSNFTHGHSTSCDTHTVDRETVDGSNHNAYQSDDDSCTSSDSDCSVHFSHHRAVLSSSDSEPDVSPLTDTGIKSSPGARDLTQTNLKRPPADMVHSATSSGQQMKKAKLETTSDLTDVVVAFVPNKKVVKHFTATECERNRPRHCPLDFHMCVYHIWQRQWLYVGVTRFPEKFEDRDAWRMTCANGKAYFVSVNRRKLHALDLKTMTWSEVDCQCLFTTGPKACRVRSMLPMAVDNKLYILASDKQLQDDDSGACVTTQHYSLLGENNEWEPITSVEHFHMATPITLCNVSGKKVYVVKATLPLNLEKIMLHVEDSHIFDSETETSEIAPGVNYCTSPLRLLVRNGEMHTVDGQGIHGQLSREPAMWISLGVVNLTDIKVGRAACAESYMPCVSHSTTVMGSSSWEFSTSSHQRSALTELRLNDEGDIFTVRHTPPPFCYMTITAACQLSSEFVASLQTCHFLHAFEED